MSNALTAPLPDEHPVRTRLARAGRWLAERPWLLLPLFAVPALLPLVTEGLPRTFDGTLHMLRIASLDRALRAGVFLPRWQPESLLGYGYPTLNYYAPASYYVIELLHLLGLTIPQAFGAFIVLTVLAAGFGAYWLALDLFGGQRAPAMAAATAYMLAPYLLVNIYNRGALAEAGAQALLPWLLWCARRLFVDETPARPTLLLALLLAALATMHTISLLFMPALLVAYMLVAGAQSGRLRARWAWAAGAILAAMAASAFFWLPLLFERDLISSRGLEIARLAWLPSGVWSWQTFVERSFVYTISSFRPVRLGLVQLVLAIAGVLLARRRDAEWLFWIALALICGLLVGAWALPLWQNTLLSIAQFPWRLLSLLSLPLALLAGGIASGMPAGWPRLAAAAAVCAVVLLAQAPRLRDMNALDPQAIRLDAAASAMMDLDRGAASGGEGSSSVQEFRPRWAAATLELAEQPPASDPAPAVSIVAANAHDLELQVSAAAPVPLRFSTFYFPGWQVLLDRATPLETRPETNLGLLSVTVPAGEHTLRVRWAGTPLERAATLISLAAWAGLGLAALVYRMRRPQAAPSLALALLPLALAAAGLAGLLWTRDLAPVTPPQADPGLAGVRLLGAQIDTSSPAQAAIRPFWQITEAVSDRTLVHWQLQDEAGAVLSDYRVRPYFNTSSAREWAADTIVDDAYLLALPAGLVAGEYRLAVALVEGNEPPASALEPVFTFQLEQPVPEDPQPQTSAPARFGDQAALAGYSLAVNGREISGDLAQAGAGPAAVEPGDRVDLTLYWRPVAPLYDNYHAFVHLVDVDGTPLAQKDQSPGPLVLSPELWLPGRTYADRYRLRIPKWAESGIYTPWVGMYVFETVERLPARTEQGASGDHVALPPIKVVAEQKAAPDNLDIQIGDFATLSGVSAAPAGVVAPGSTFTVTLAYRSSATTSLDLTRFLQLYSSEHGMAAQADGIPQRRFNPTWAWIPGELIVEEVVMETRADAPAGEYTLLAGFYDPASGARVPLMQDGLPVPDSAAPLLKMQVSNGVVE